MFWKQKWIEMACALILVALTLGVMGCNEKIIIRSRYNGRPFQVTRQDGNYYQGRSDWACVPANLKSLAIFYEAWELAGMTQLQIIQRHDLDYSGYMNQYEYARCALTYGIDVEQIASCSTPDQVLIELAGRVDLRHPTVVGLGYGDNGEVGHLVTSVGYLRSDRG